MASAYVSDFCSHRVPAHDAPSSQDADGGPGSGGRRKEINASLVHPLGLVSVDSLSAQFVLKENLHDFYYTQTTA